MALLSTQARATSVEAEKDVAVYTLDAADFDRMLEHAPITAAKLLRNIALELTATVNTQTETILQLETKVTRPFNDQEQDTTNQILQPLQRRAACYATSSTVPSAIIWSLRLVHEALELT